MSQGDYNTMYQETGEKDFYDAHYRSKGDGAMRPLWVYEKWFKLFGSVQPGTELLDVACGTGYFLKVASERGVNTHGIELSDDAVALSKKNAPLADVRQGYGEALPFQDKMFDYVSCLGSLEHFQDPAKGLSEMVRVAKDSAILLIVLPNMNYWLWKTGWVPTGTKQRNFEILKDFEGWSQFLEQAGLDIIHVGQDKYPAHEISIFDTRSPIKMIRRLLYKSIWMFIPLRSTYQFVFTLKKSEHVV